MPQVRKCHLLVLGRWSPSIAEIDGSWQAKRIEGSTPLNLLCARDEVALAWDEKWITSRGAEPRFPMNTGECSLLVLKGRG